MANKKTLEERGADILEKAKAAGMSDNYFFTTTFQRYQTQLRILSDLEGAIEEYGATVTKEYVKGRQNLVANPAISEYNKTSTAANGTVSTLLNILKSIPAESDGSKLSEFLNDE